MSHYQNGVSLKRYWLIMWAIGRGCSTGQEANASPLIGGANIHGYLRELIVWWPIFFANEFSRNVLPGEEYLYKISIAIAEKLYEGDLQMAIVGEEFDGERRFGGILYPTLAMRANSDNVALLPEFADKYLRLDSVEWIRVDSVNEDFDSQYQITVLDFAKSFGDAGNIEWKGRLSQWTVPAGAMFLAKVENGNWVVRNHQGEIVEPS